QADLSSGIIGTINYCYGDKVIPAVNTTPGPIELQSLLNDMAKSACRYCVMEVSSHALSQERTAGIDFESAIFTNLTPDHLDYHKTLENYFLAKSGLFSSLKAEASAIVNLDSPYGARLRSLSRGRFVGYAIDSSADFKARDLSLSLEGSEFVLEARGIKSKIKTRLLGRHNILNILAAIAFGVTQKIELPQIQKAVENFEGVRGRLCRVKARARNVFIDYAHTPDALENVLSVLRQFTKGRLRVVFGCGGERDRMKRPLMGEVAEKYSDTIIITSDNPRSEEPLAIAKEIAAGIKTKEYKIIPDRRQAIELALEKSNFSDTVLIAGKGHENYQIFKDNKIEFDDQIAAEEYIREKGL
ncbi:MAG: UDP-N-acetylmuramoyl-L-alanyl-D-glutamate--2,6-diaminopimelate ligase, partial [Candidatus Omnitrophota bacterium]